MKYCLNSRVAGEYLKQVDEIKVSFRDRESIPDIAVKYPDKKIILEHLRGDAILDEKGLKNYNILTKGNLILCAGTVEELEMAKSLNIPFYFGYPISSYYELLAFKDLGVCYFLLNAPLSFRVDVISTFGIPIRLIPNVADLDGFPRENTYNGTWIRPENVEDYEKYVDTFEFGNCEGNVLKEQALFRVYAIEKNWPGSLEQLIDGFKFPNEVLNRIINPKDTAMRIFCGQICAQPGTHCRICDRALKLAEPNLIKEAKALIN